MMLEPAQCHGHLAPPRILLSINPQVGPGTCRHHLSLHQSSQAKVTAPASYGAKHSGRLSLPKSRHFHLSFAPILLTSTMKTGAALTTLLAMAATGLAVPTLVHAPRWDNACEVGYGAVCCNVFTTACYTGITAQDPATCQEAQFYLVYCCLGSVCPPSFSFFPEHFTDRSQALPFGGNPDCINSKTLPPLPVDPNAPVVT